MSKIGAFMGSFDPPHIGHLSIITETLNSGIVDDVYVIPAWKNVWKNTTTSFSDRALMCAMSLIEQEDVRISRIEESIANTSEEFQLNGIPSYIVMEEFVKMHNLILNSVYFITTEETYAEIPLWEKGEEILQEYVFIICGQKDILLPHINVSSTMVRERLKTGKRVFPYITYDTAEYIQKKGLYV